MKILVTGSTGLVGSAVVKALNHQRHDVIRLMRFHQNFPETQVFWDIQNQQIDASKLEGMDAVIHLAGENIASGLWTDSKKQAIYSSRVQGTQLLATTLASLKQPPKVLICASAIGYYGSQGNKMLTEVSNYGKGFLADTCKAWEKASLPASEKGIRVAHARFGIILSPDGGALKAMYWPFRLGLAGDLGNGKQYMSWIMLDDVVGSLLHILNQADLSGPVNVVAPNAVSNGEFTSAMRKTLIPALLPMHYWTPPAPAFAVSTLLGELGRELLLTSTRVQPVRLLESGYTFKFPTLKPALSEIL
jgi:uncharacterized protein